MEVTQYNGDLGRSFYKTDKALYGFGGLSVSHYLGKLFDANLLLTKGTLGYRGDTGSFKSDFNAASLNLRFNLTAPEYGIRPYVVAGAGFSNPVATNNTALGRAKNRRVELKTNY